MREGIVQLIVIAIYLGLLLVLGVFASRMFRGTKKDYMLASHSIGPFLLLMSLFGTTMTAFAMVGSSGEAYKEGIGVYGMLASSSGIIHSLCFFVVGIKLWSLGRRYGYTTQIEYFRDRLDSDLIGLFLFPILVGMVIPYLLLGVMASGTVVQTMTSGAFPDWAMFQTPDKPSLNGGVPPWLGSAVICLVVLCYVFFGGMRGTAWANAFQTLVFMVLGFVTFLIIADKVGGESTFMADLRAASARVPIEKTTRLEMSKMRFFTYLFIPLSVGMFPHLFQHWLTARSAQSFKIPVICHPIFIMIVWVPCVLIGIWASGIELPPAIAGNPNAVLPFLVKAKTNALLGGLLAAGILAAIMSSLDSQFLCLGTIFTNDVVGHYLGRDRFSDRQQVVIARCFIVAIVFVTYLLSLQGYRSVFALGVWCFTGFASLFPLIIGALYWRRLTAPGAIAGVLAMILTWMYHFWKADFGAHGEYYLDVFGYSMQPVVATFAACLIAMVGISLVTKPPKDETIRKHFGTA
jgi:SSS family solute:Na+ symporter